MFFSLFSFTIDAQFHSSYRFGDTIGKNHSKNIYAGFRIDVGGFYHRYNGLTKNWLGDYNSPGISFKFNINQFFASYRFLPTTVNPGISMMINSEELTRFAKLNVLNNNVYLGYSFDFPYLISFQPKVGWNGVYFVVINEEELNKTYDIPKVNGWFVGADLNKHFHLDSGPNDPSEFFFSIYASINYSWTDFTPINERLNNNFIFWGFGVSFSLLY